MNVPAAPREYFPYSKKFLNGTLSSQRNLENETMNPPYSFLRKLYGGHQDRDDRMDDEPLEQRETLRS